MVPVDVVEHLLPGIDERIERANPLLGDDDAPLSVDFSYAQRIEQPWGIDTSVWHVAAAGVAR